MLKKLIKREKEIQNEYLYNKDILYKKISMDGFFTEKKKIFIILPKDAINLFGLLPLYRFLKVFYSSEHVYGLLSKNFLEFKELVTEFDDIFLFSEDSLFNRKEFDQIKDCVLESDLVINFLEEGTLPEIISSYSRLSINFSGKYFKYFNLNYEIDKLNFEKSFLNFFTKKEILSTFFYKFKKKDVLNMINFLYNNGYTKNKVLINLNNKIILSEKEFKGNYFLNLGKGLVSKNNCFILINIDDEDLRSKFYMEFSKFDYNILFINKLSLKEQLILSALSYYSVFNFSYYYLLSSLYCHNSILLVDSEDLKKKLFGFFYFKNRIILGYNEFLLKNFF